MDFQYLEIERKEKLAIVTIKRPEALNALNEAVLGEINSCVDTLEAEEIRVAIFTGTGKAFIAGADIASMREYGAKEAYAFCNFGQSVFTKLANSSVICIAAINGFALGGGLEFALSCDLRVIAEPAKIGLPEVSLGIIPGFGGTQRLARLVGKGTAAEVILTGDMYSAEDAYRMGIVNKICKPEELLESAEKFAKSILAKGPNAITRAKTVIRKGLDGTLEEGLYQEKSTFSALFGQEESKEGLTAFLEKRKANFS
ncbi:MAG: enoyl-CoA hydratase-related protein [Spirochaetota bacterium]